MTFEEREVAICEMKQASDGFYRMAIAINVHQFIEFCGLMNEYINACEHAHKSGIDFSECNGHNSQLLPMESFMIHYVNEKLNCIFTGRIALTA